ncbi:hypothetical protein DIPPA_06879 [Diplonema papillatum]|nr:hypothetical protein DIPPA_06879 [Diplonema papillatum]
MRSSNALHEAVVNNHLDVVQYLLASGANPNAVDKLYHTTPLALAKSPQAIDLLLSYNADVTCVNFSGSTALHEITKAVGHGSRALRAEYGRVVDLFVSRGADVNAMCNSRLTPYVIAWMLGSKRAGLELQRHGAKCPEGYDIPQLDESMSCDSDTEDDSMSSDPDSMES